MVDIYNKSLPFLSPVINRPTRVTKTSATITNHILTNSIIDTTLYSGIVKTDISDRFAIFRLLRTNFEQSNINNIIIKRGINGAIIEHFKSLINSIDSGAYLHKLHCQMVLIIFFEEKFVQTYNLVFPGRIIEIKPKNVVSPWISGGLRKSSRKIHTR